jgi:hypothetical protein
MAMINWAQEVYRSNGDQLLVPRQKFNFTLILDQVNSQSVVFHRVSTVTAPGYSIDTQILNQYNKKRVIQTRLNYDPITVSFYDTFDDTVDITGNVTSWHDIMRQYITYYYNGGGGIEKRITTEGTETVDINFETDLGYTPVEGRYFFPRIRIIQNGHRYSYRETTLINPMITSIQGDTLDYSDSQPVQYTVQFQPESVQTEVVLGAAPYEDMSIRNR